ncbi:hypothetical protein BGZ91_003819, partial [Linnemannia elongata]
ATTTIRTTVDPPKTTTTDTYTKPSEATTTTRTTVDPPKTTTTDTYTKPSEATTTTSAAPVTTTDIPTTTTTDSPPTTIPTTTMSTAGTPTTTKDPPVTTTEPPVTTTTTTPPVTTTDPPVTTTTTNPPVTTTDPPVTTTTKDPPVMTTTTTNDPPVTTTRVPPVTTTTTTTTIPPVGTTTTPYTTRYVTTMSIVTVTTVLPETTVISGRGTTVYITRSTVSPVPTIIQDPTQDPPPGTQVDSSSKGGLQPWQITLIIVATLVVIGAVGAVVLVGRIKRQRKRRDTMLFSGDGPESVLGSEMSESGGGKSNRALLVGGQQNHYHSGQSDSGGSGWRERLSAWRPWNSLDSYHHQQYPGGLDYNQGTGQGGGGGAGGLWLTDESDPHYDGSTAAAGVAAAMRPVSYDTNGRLSGPGDIIVGEEDPYYYGNYPYNIQAQGSDYDQEESAYAATAMAAAPRGAAGTLHPLDDIGYPSLQRDFSSVTNAATAMTSRSQQRHLQQQQPSRGSLSGQTSPSIGQLERLSTEEGSDYIDSQGYHRSSQDWTVSSVTSAGAGVGVGTGTGANEDRTSVRVDPGQLESHAKFEHFRKAPQAILGTPPPKRQDFVIGRSPPPLPSAPPPPQPSSTTATDMETMEMIADVDRENNNTARTFICVNTG